jgi:hypothetical protein
MMMMMMMFQHGCSYVLVGDLHGRLRLCDRVLGCGTDGDIYLMATCNDTTAVMFDSVRVRFKSSGAYKKGLHVSDGARTSDLSAGLVSMRPRGIAVSRYRGMAGFGPGFGGRLSDGYTDSYTGRWWRGDCELCGGYLWVRNCCHKPKACDPCHRFVSWV